MKDRIIEMLGHGVSAVQVAQAVGCDESYISQLLSSPEIFEAVSLAKAKHFSAYVEQDNFLDDAEKNALEKVATLIPFITRPSDAVRVYGVLNAAKRRTTDAATHANAVAATVSLDLPEASRVRFTITADKQVIEIEGRSMATMPARTLAARLEQRNADRLLATNVPLSLTVPTLANKL